MTEDSKIEDTKTEATKAETKTAEAPATQTASAIAPEEMARLTDEIVGALKTVYDPEIPADIYELGLIYKVDIDDDRVVKIDMTLTTPNCPSAACARPRSTSSGIRRGIRAGCRTRPAPC